MKKFIAAAALLLAACSGPVVEAEFLSDTYYHYQKEKLTAFEGDVAQLSSLPPIGSYAEIGMVRVPASTGAASIVPSLKAAAAKVGGDAIVLYDDAREVLASGGAAKTGYASAIVVKRFQR